MKAEDPRAIAWRNLLATAMEQAGYNQTRLADELGCSRALVSQWLSPGKIPPEPDVVFAIEDALGCPDLLATVLGYVRRSDAPETVQAIQADPTLTRGQRGTLLDLYRVMVQGRGD